MKDDFQEIRTKVFKKNYIPKYPARYIQDIEHNTKGTYSESNSYRQKSDLELLEAIKEGRAR